ncbi:MAG: glycoside hydrolase/phage tail family protein [Mesorhizobium sp.]|nr:glycoside hydrolase/phage tail family protein [Mesorhizobium sp.]
MATLILQAAGAFLGGFLGPVGAAIGTAAGSMAGYMIDRALITSTQHQEGPRLQAMRPFTAEDGAPVPRVYGTARLGGTLIWATRFEESRQSKRQGFKGAKTTTYTYFANAAFGLCEGPVAGIRRVWADGREIDLTLVDIRLHQGRADQAPDPLVEAKQGAGNTPAYRGTAYVVIDRFPLDDYGNRLPQFQFEVLRPVGDFAARLRAVTLIPGATEYGLAAGLVSNTLGRGDSQMVNRHVLHAASDLDASLDELQALCPNLRHVALVVTWFGDDLRAGHCRIRPMLASAAGPDLSSAWRVSGLTRDSAQAVSEHEGSPAYGGTPSDDTVVAAIAALKQRGWNVTLYPFVMMDVPADNELPDPYGGGAQAAYPWRGRITCHPGPGQPGTADRTGVARDQVEALCGAAAAGDFTPAGGTVDFAGAADDWGYRRMVLHYAHLAELAGGVEGFLIGSELRGLTTLRDGADAFPFVEQLMLLASDVRGIVGGGTRLTYGADWSEYFGYQPPDGSGDVFFHLDPLWAHDEIDAVGIDNYLPLSDWRDADYGGGNPDGFASPYDSDGLRRAIDSGEGFDWYYPDEDARANRARAPISDGLAGKPWVFRPKDIRAWWSSPHFERSGGAEAATPTAWAPQSKPVWFTELGCAAVDKGPNQPNVFPDPKSAESALPYFSDGGRSDLAQRRFLTAHLDHWDPASVSFDGEANPISAVYGGRMIDAERIYVWTWDARPFPAFPLDTGAWADGLNWLTGHWLNGRLGGVSAGDLIGAILADHGLGDVLDEDGVSHIDGFLHGYVIDQPGSARQALEPLIALFGLAATGDGGRLAFRSEGAVSGTAHEIADMVVPSDATAMLEIVRTPDRDLPAEAMLSFRDPMADYQQASARSVHAGTSGQAQAGLGFPGTLEPAQAEALLGGWMRRTWQGRETVRFAVAGSDRAPSPGRLIGLPGQAGEFIVTKVEEGLSRSVEARRIARLAPFADRARLPVGALPPSTFAGKPFALFLDLPLAGDRAPHEQFRVAVFAAPWKTQQVLAAPGFSGFEPRATIVQPATVGQLTSALGAGFEGRIDRAGAIEVHLDHGELASVDTPRMLNGANAAAIRSGMGAWEFFQFASAEEIAPSIWRLTQLLRGQLGTIDAARAGAAIGADFVLLDDAVQPAGLRASEAGLTLNWRAGPAGHDLSALHFISATETGGLRALAPLSPAHLRAAWQADGALALGWIRRGRIDADSWLGPDIPLGEESEAYRVTVATTAGAVLREATVTTPGWTYGAATIAADFPVLPAGFDIAVRQIGAAGDGIAATIRVATG